MTTFIPLPSGVHVVVSPGSIPSLASIMLGERMPVSEARRIAAMIGVKSAVLRPDLIEGAA